MEKAALSINMEPVTSAVVIALVVIALAAIGKSAWSWATRLKPKLASQQHKKVPAKLRTWVSHFVVMTCLVWMLQATMRAASSPASPADIALIAGWMWAVLSYTLHMLRDSG